MAAAADGAGSGVYALRQHCITYQFSVADWSDGISACCTLGLSLHQYLADDCQLITTICRRRL